MMKKIAEIRKLFFVQEPISKGMYSAGPKRGMKGMMVPGGPIGYVRKDDAGEVAAATGWQVAERGWNEAIAFCAAHNYTLWISHPGGRLAYVEETISGRESILPRVAGAVRDALGAFQRKKEGRS